MKQHLSIARAVLHKDFRQLCWTVVVVAILTSLWRFPNFIAKLGPVAAIVEIAVILASLTLIFLVIFDDTIVSAKHDWLTRPIPGSALLIAKVSFITIALLLPSIVGAIAYHFSRGYLFGESLLSGLSEGAKGDTLMLIVMAMACAAITSGIRQVIIAFVVGALVLSVLVWAINDLSGMAVEHAIVGTDWILERTVAVIGVGLSFWVLWVQFSQHRTGVAWLSVAIATVVVTTFAALLTWPRTFAIQKSFAPDPQAAQTVQVELATGCLPASRVDRAAGVLTAADFRSEAMRQWIERLEGPDATAFATPLIERSAPSESKLVVTRVAGTYKSAGHVEKSLQSLPLPPKWTESAGTLTVNHSWLLSRTDYERLAALPDVELQMDYSLSLLTPKAAIELSADGRRDYFPGLGYCGATFNKVLSQVDVDCYKYGAQPALLMATVVGAPRVDGKASRTPNYVPAWLDFFGGKRHLIRLSARNVDAPRVKIVAYEARAHFDRHFTIPGVLGGTAAACPAPM